MTQKELNSIMKWQGLVGIVKWPFKWNFIKYGVDSGFSPCCITWYKVRCLWLYSLELILGQAGQEVATNITLNDKVLPAEYTRHVLCPCCRVKYGTKLNEMKYYSCDNHGKDGWYQFRNSTCNLCKNKDMRLMKSPTELTRRFF
jgi:hypothetical protein